MKQKMGMKQASSAKEIRRFTRREAAIHAPNVTQHCCVMSWQERNTKGGRNAKNQLNINHRWRSAATCGGGRVGLRRRFKAPISSEARVRIPSSAKLFGVTSRDEGEMWTNVSFFNSLQQPTE